MDRVELENILKMHQVWLTTVGAEGRRANLRRANLRGANLRVADLYGADLSGADLSGADLFRADLHEADLGGADLSGANLFRADLHEADLGGANLYGANLKLPTACPEEGAFIGFKKVTGNYIVKLEITEDAQRSSATGRKCRCSKARVLSITTLDGSESGVTEVASKRDANFIYRVGETVEVPDFEPDRWKECAPGIHFFITRQEAVDY